VTGDDRAADGFDGLPDWTGAELGRYRLVERIGVGRAATVYSANDGTLREPIAVKVFNHPERVEIRESDLQVVAALRHPGVVPVYEYRVSDEGIVYLAMAMAPGGSLAAALGAPSLDRLRAVEIVDALAAALDAAHNQGVVHQDLKPSNVLLGPDGEPLLTDFGISRTGYGLVGTPGYLAPERLAGGAVDRRADIYALAAMAFEMLTGTPAHVGGSPAELLRATADAPVPLASERDPDLPRQVDAAFLRALAKDPRQRHATARRFAEDLAASAAAPAPGPAPVPAAAPAPAPPEPPPLLALPAPAAAPEAGGAFEQSVAKLHEILDLALTASVMVDETSFVLGWNGLAEQAFGWTREEIVGRSLVTTLIPHRFREAHERGLRHYMETGEGAVFGVKLQLAALHRDGRELPIELSISEAVRSGSAARILAFIRDVSAERRTEQVRLARDAVVEAVETEADLEAAAPRILEALGANLGWQAALLWTADPTGRTLRCLHHWTSPDLAAADFVAAARRTSFAIDDGLPGRVLASAEPVWAQDFIAEEDSSRVLAAARAGIRSAVAAPVLAAGQVGGVFELFSTDARPEDAELLMHLYAIGGRIGRRSARRRPDAEAPPPAAPARPERETRGAGE
jgi:PAS domain S-box-containing protein